MTIETVLVETVPVYTVSDALDAASAAQTTADGAETDATAALARAASWFSGEGVPSDSVGADNDLYLYTDESSLVAGGPGDVYQKAAGTWQLEGTVRPPASASVLGKQWWVGSGAPSAGLGSDGEFYYDQTNKDIYEKAVTFGSVTPTSKLAETGTTSSTTTLTTSGTAALANNRLETLVVTLSGPSTAQTISSITGAGMTWVAVRTAQVASYTVATYRALVTSGATTGAITVNFSGGGVGTTRYAVHVSEWTGMDTGGTNGSSAVVQSASNAAHVVNQTTLSVALSAFADSVHNVTFAAFFHAVNEGATPGAGMTEISDTNGATPVLGLETEWQLGQNLAPSASWATTPTHDSAGVAIEIAAAQSGAAWSKVGLLLGSGTVSQSSPADPTGTTNTTETMAGLAASFTPKGSRVMIIISGVLANTSGNGGSAQIRYGTGSAPANAAALTGTAVGAKIAPSSGTTGGLPFSVNAIVTGLTAGTAYWIDLAVARVGGAGTTSVTTISVSANEV